MIIVSFKTVRILSFKFQQSFSNKCSICCFGISNQKYKNNILVLEFVTCVFLLFFTKRKSADDDDITIGKGDGDRWRGEAMVTGQQRRSGCDGDDKNHSNSQVEREHVLTVATESATRFRAVDERERGVV